MEMKPHHAERIRLLEERLGLTLVHPKLGLAALAHRTYVNENRERDAEVHSLEDSQRLEFLGDAVVDLAVSTRLFARLPTMPEGELTRLRAMIVNEEGLARVARRLGLGELLLLGRGEELSGARDRRSLLADALEAVIGAVYLGAGLEPVLALVDRHFAEVMDEALQGLGRLDYKTLLQVEVHERLKVSPRYRVVGETGPEHSKVFEVEVLIGEAPYARATGRSKKEAEQSAASATLEMLRKDDTPA